MPAKFICMSYVHCKFLSTRSMQYANVHSKRKAFLEINKPDRNTVSKGFHSQKDIVYKALITSNCSSCWCWLVLAGSGAKCFSHPAYHAIITIHTAPGHIVLHHANSRLTHTHVHRLRVAGSIGLKTFSSPGMSRAHHHHEAPVGSPPEHYRN